MSVALDVVFFEPAPIAERRAEKFCDITVLLPPGFTLQSGEILSRPEVALRIHGEEDAPAILVSGGISSGRSVADAGNERGWWRDVVSAGGAIDLARFRVIGADFLPNPGETARTISTGDQARALAFALDAIGVARLHAFVGASYGGMLGLAFAEAFPTRLDKLCVISAADRPHPSATALRGIQRRIIDLATRAGNAAEGLSLARQLAMTTYRTPEEFAARFAHRPGGAAGDPYAVCEYLIARGDAYQMVPERYVTLSDSIDRHAVNACAIATPALFVAVDSDRLVPSEHIRLLAAKAAHADYVEIASLYGHDAFLKEPGVIGPIIRSFIEEC
ncbi:MAG: homoserine O-succinyltransferase [Parvularculaceae bacterium]